MACVRRNVPAVGGAAREVIFTHHLMWIDAVSLWTDRWIPQQSHSLVTAASECRTVLSRMVRAYGAPPSYDTGPMFYDTWLPQ